MLLLHLDSITIGRRLNHLLLSDLELHQLLRLQLDLLPFRICFTILDLDLFERLVLFMKHLIMLFQCVLVHDLQHVLILLILVLKISHALLVSGGEHVDFFLVGDLQLLLHLFEGLHVKFSLV